MSSEIAIHLVSENAYPEAGKSFEIPAGAITLPGLSGMEYIVNEEPLYHGAIIEDVGVSLNEEHEGFSLDIVLTMDAGHWFGEFSLDHVGCQLAVVCQGIVLTAPVLPTPIDSGILQVTAMFTQGQAQHIACALLGKEEPSIEAFNAPAKEECPLHLIDYDAHVRRILVDLDNRIAASNGDLISRYRKARILWGEGRLDEVLEDCELLLSSDYRTAEILAGRATVMMELQRYAEAIEDFNKAEELGAPVEDFADNRAFAYVELGQAEKALTDANFLIGLYPDAAEAYHLRGDIYCDLEQYELSIPDFDKAIKEYSYFLDVSEIPALIYNNKACAHYELGQFDDALKAVDTALEIEPNFSDALEIRGHIHEQLGHSEKALADYKHAVSINPNLTESSDGIERLS